MEGGGDGEEPKDPQKGGCWGGGDEPEPEPPAPEPPCRSVVDYDTPRELRKALLTMKKSSPKDDEEETEASAATTSTNMPMKSGDGSGSSLKTEKESTTMDERSNSTSVSVAQQQPQPQPEQQQQPLDWVLQSFDPQVTKVQSMQEELDRLLVLKSYLILDSQRDEAFELLTRMASRFFKTPISAISLIDLGRQWFVSTQGLGEGDAAVKQTPRNVAFCAHTIQVKENSQLMIVPDAKLDARFCDNPFVVGNVVRFYAGAPLLSPEGYKLGSFCVIDSEPRPEPGLTLTEQAQLRDLASLAVRHMVDRRSLLQRRRKRRSRKPRKRRSVTTAPSSAAASVAAAAGATGAEASQQHHEDEQSDYEDDYEDDDYDDDEEDPEQLIAHAANDLMTPLSGVQLSLGLLKDDEQVKEKLNHHQLELLHTAASCSDFTIRICRTAINSLRQQQQQHHHQQQLQHAPSNHHPIHQHRDPAAVLKRQHSANSLSSNCSSQSSPCDLMAASLSAAADAVQQQQQRQQHEQNQPPPPVLTTVLLDLLNGLAMVMKPIPKLTPIILTLEQQQSDDKPPRVIQCDDLKLFRSALNLLSHALKRTLIGAVHLRIYPTTTAADSNSNKIKRSSWKNGTRLMFECMDTGPLVPKEEWNHLFKTGGGSYQNPHFHDTALDEDGAGMLDQSLGLSSVATFIHSLHGDYGFREEESFGGDDGKQPHSVFWFSVPLIVDKPKSDPARKTAMSKAEASTPGATATADKSDNGATSTSSVVTDSRQSSMQDDGRQNQQQQQQPAATDTAATQTATDPTDTACQRTRSLSCAAALVGNTMEAMPERRNRGLSGGTLLELAGSAAMQLERNLSNPGLHEHFDSGNEKLSAAAASSSSSTSFPPSNLQVVVGDLLHATTALQKSQGTSSSFPSLLYEKHEQKQALEARAATVAAGSPLLFSSTSPLFTGQSATTAAGVPSLFLPNTIQSFSDVIADAATAASCKLKDVGQPNQSWPATRTMNNAPTTATATTTTSPIGRRKKRGLVIDDSLVVRKSLARALERQDFEVQQAVNGLEGLNLLKETLFDLVLCDFLMPVMDGMDCVKQYRDWEREHHSGFRQYIVGISAHATSNDGNQGIKAGMDLFKEKPISVRILSELLEADEFLQRSAEIDTKEGASSVTVVEMSEENVVGKRPAMTAALDANGFHHESFAVPPTKFLKSDHAVDSSLPPMSETKKAAPACLIATKALTQESHQILTNLENNGWETAVANDGQEALRLLQTRNWDAICMDDDLPILAGTPCMTKFRAWEAEHRVNRQRMALLICSSHDVKIPPPLDDDKTSIVLPPHGFDGVLGKPVQWNELNHLLQRRTTGRSFDIVIRK